MTISINITFDATDIVAIRQLLVAKPNPIPAHTPVLTKDELADFIDTTLRKLGIPEVSPPNLTPFHSIDERPRYTTVPADEKPAPQRTKSDSRPPERPSSSVTPTAPSVPSTPATEAGDDTAESTESTEEGKRTRPKTMPFTELDPLVRKEMKRLSMEGRMPGFKLWDTERDPRLPSLAALLYRYSANNTAELAAKMGLQPPLGNKSTSGPHEPVAEQQKA
jgi:hypothetical protein